MTAIFDSGIFDSGIFKTSSANGIFSSPPFDKGIFDHAGTIGTFDTGIFDRNIFDNILGPVVVPPRGLIQPPPIYGGFQKKKPKKKDEIVAEVAAAVEQAVPDLSHDESRLVALRLVAQMTWAQLRRIDTLESFIARVEAELAEMDDEEILLLAA